MHKIGASPPALPGMQRDHLISKQFLREPFNFAATGLCHFLRSDKVFAVDNGGQLNLFGKFAYAHDEISNPQANVAFAAIGGIGGAAPFTVFGGRPSRDLALTTAGAEWRLTNGVSFLVKFDGEFGDRSETYSGTGRIRYTW